MAEELERLQATLRARAELARETRAALLVLTGLGQPLMEFRARAASDQPSAASLALTVLDQPSMVFLVRIASMRGAVTAGEQRMEYQRYKA